MNANSTTRHATRAAADSASVAPQIDRITARAAAALGFAPLSDQLAADLRDGIGTTIIAGDGRSGFAHLSPRADGWTLQVVVDPAAERGAGDRLGAELVAAAVATVRDAGGGRVDWWVFDAGDPPASAAATPTAGFVLGRELHQMRRTLPADGAATIDTRPFRPGADDAAWLAVNNRAFAAHPEQGGWDQRTLERRMAEPWFDPDGLRLYEHDGQVAAFCWTKLHPPTDAESEVVGEIYVIGVDPVLHGRGLGRELTLAGLDWITAQGVGAAMLYVDAANEAAVGLYRSLGFSVSRTDRAYHLDVAPDQADTPPPSGRAGTSPR